MDEESASTLIEIRTRLVASLSSAEVEWVCDKLARLSDERMDERIRDEIASINEMMRQVNPTQAAVVMSGGVSDDEFLGLLEEARQAGEEQVD